MRLPAWLARTVAISLALTMAACATPSGNSAPRNPGCLTDFNPDTDYFPDKSTVTEAKNFRLSYHNSYQVLTVEQPYPGGSPESYVLLRCGAPAPQLTGDLARAQRIPVPVKSLYSASTTQLGMVTELGWADVVLGVATAANIVNPHVRQRVAAGKVVEYAPGQQVDVETVIAGRPDVLVTEGTDNPRYAKLRDAGVNVVADTEWLEPTPLGRAEWVKVFAALTGTEKKAARVYDQLRDDYRHVAKKAIGVQSVEVLPGTLYQGTWSVPAGGSYAGRLVVDAGGRYPWADDKRTGILQLNLESVYAEAGHAPLGLVTSNWQTLDDALAADSRYGAFAAVLNGQVWSPTKLIAPGGGNDYWERGAARPDLVLADLVAILHPELASNHPFKFYRRVPRR
jgi:cobalamin transport system substrate-binding protein